MSPTGDLLVTQFFLGKCPLELAQGPSCVALAWHKARGSTPFGVTKISLLLLLPCFFACFLALPPPPCLLLCCCLAAALLSCELPCCPVQNLSFESPSQEAAPVHKYIWKSAPKASKRDFPEIRSLLLERSPPPLATRTKSYPDSPA